MLAQPLQVFDKFTWIAMFAICLGAPLAGFIIGWVLGGQRYLKTRWKWIVGYYAMACIPSVFFLSANGFSSESAEFMGCVFIVLLLFGPILGFALYAIPSKGVRYPDGHCQTCGYNLTGNVTGRCPECGTDAKYQTDQDELARQHVKSRVPWVLGALTIAILVALPAINQSSSSFLIGFWMTSLVFSLTVTVLVVLRRK